MGPLASPGRCRGGDLTQLPTCSRHQHRQLGKSDMMISAIGLGCMSLSGVYGAADDATSEALIRHALDHAVNS